MSDEVRFGAEVGRPSLVLVHMEDAPCVTVR